MSTQRPCSLLLILLVAFEPLSRFKKEMEESKLSKEDFAKEAALSETSIELKFPLYAVASSYKNLVAVGKYSFLLLFVW